MPALGDVDRWLLSGRRPAEVAAIIAAAATADRTEFAAELDARRGELDAAYPGDPGIVVALLMNLVTLRRGEGAVRAGRRAARLPGGPRRRAHGGERQRAARRAHTQAHRCGRAADGARSDAGTGADRCGPSRSAAGLERFDAGVPDFALLHARPHAGAAGRRADRRRRDRARDARGGDRLRRQRSAAATLLRPATRCSSTPDERMLRIAGAARSSSPCPAR